MAMNDKETFAGHYDTIKKAEKVYTNENVASIMDVYWITVTCVYIAISFLTFAWGITWIIWPIAALVEWLINDAYTVKNK